MSLQRQPVSTYAPATAPPIVHEVLRSSGQPLDASTRAFFEPRFGYDFSGVHVHSDTRAAESAQAVDALAYTVGQDIVFNSHQFVPNITGGQKLLAHELTHVMQQTRGGGNTWIQPRLRIVKSDDASEREADAAAASVRTFNPPVAKTPSRHDLQKVPERAVQRAPAPPTYKGVTGVRDMDKIRIDAIPDFLAKDLTATREINAHILDPAIVHLTWELFGPKDNYLTGFSTLPGHPNSTTKPFPLDPANFSGTGFKEGTHLLRCSGLNADNQPVAYADRHFRVLQSDLTTGTALPTTYGDLKFTKYEKTDANRPATPNFTVDVQLSFLPKSSVACDNVAFIQAVQGLTAEGESRQRFVNPEQDARKTPLAWSIDRVAGAPAPFYIAGRLPSGAVTDVPGWGHKGSGGKSPTDATLIDQATSGASPTKRFESCVACRGAKNRGQVYGCATWGYSADAAGKVTLMPRTFAALPSEQFTEARAAWNAWRTKTPAATRPEEAPVLTAP